MKKKQKKKKKKKKKKRKRKEEEEDVKTKKKKKIDINRPDTTILHRLLCVMINLTCTLCYTTNLNMCMFFDNSIFL